MFWDPTSRTFLYERWKHPFGEQRWYFPGVGFVRRVGPQQGLHDAVAQLPGFPDGIDGQLRSEAILDAMTALKSQTWNAGVALAESAGVAKMVYDLGSVVGECRSLLQQRRYKDTYRAFEKKIPRKFTPYPKWKAMHRRELRKTRDGRAELKNKLAVPKTWLYYHFGIKPTIDDINDAVNAVALSATEQPLEFGGVTRGYAVHTLKDSLYGGNLSVGYSGTFAYESVRSVRVSIRVDARPSFLKKLSQMGVTNIPEALWNWAPYSWAVDYVSTMGDWISNFDAGLGWTIQEVWSEAFRTVTKVTYSPETTPGWFHTVYPGVTPGTWEQKLIDRRRVVGVYGPMGSVIPTWKRQGPSVQQISNLLSVLTQVFS